jgi:prepilin-type N-terminal cleavage/methylation domain-containing protein
MIKVMLNMFRGRVSSSEKGFSLLELMVAMGIMVVVVGAGMSSILRVVNSQQTIWNRTEMHSGVRNATELLQQEVGQAGSVAGLPAVTLSAAVAVGAHTVAVTSPSGTPTVTMFPGEQIIVVDPGDATGIKLETVTLASFTANSITIADIPGAPNAGFLYAHANGAPLMVTGGFAAGVVPVGGNGSTGTVLKLFGDINSDGNMLYVEYTCDTAGNNLYRNAMAWNTLPANKPPLNLSLVLLRNIVANPANAPCFTYQTVVVNGVTFVIDVAITLTVQTQQQDPVTKQFQKETKALLNVSPRNIFNVWQLASMTPPLNNRIQPTPATVTALLP